MNRRGRKQPELAFNDGHLVGLIPVIVLTTSSNQLPHFILHKYIKFGYYFKLLPMSTPKSIIVARIPQINLKCLSKHYLQRL